MIQINLLPQEYRRRTKTPIKLMLAFSAAVTVIALLLTWAGWLVFGVGAEVKGRRGVLELELDGLTPQVAYHKSLEAERKRYAAREEALATITSSRISWTRKVDELIDIINRGGEGDRHFVWLDDLVVTAGGGKGTNADGSLRAAGHSGSENFAQVANFLDDVETPPFIDDFYRPAPPEGTQTEVDEDLLPSEVWTFPLALSLRSPEDRP